jgi:hypothetical protein
MCRVDAATVTAQMVKFHAVRDWADVMLKGNTVSPTDTPV